MNFVELCRKGAGWPSLHRDVPVRPDGKKSWSISQEDLAAFVGQVRSRSEDLIDELRSKDALIAKLSDEKAAAAQREARLEAQLMYVNVARKVKAAAESLDLKSEDVKRLEASVS